MNRLIEKKQWLVLLPFLLLMGVMIGCGGGNAEEDDGYGEYWKDETGGGGSSKVAMTPVSSTGTGTITGRVKLTGSVPSLPDIKQKMAGHKHSAVCLSEKANAHEKSPYQWVVNDGNVANVVVFLKPLDEKKNFFDVSKLVMEKKGFQPVVTVDQPHCAFVPHVAAVFPKYIDPSNPGSRIRPNYLPSTQQLQIVNTATIDHNTRYQGATQHKAKGDETLNAGTKNPLNFTDKLQPFYRSAMTLKCAIHDWMQGYVWAFPHPYYAVTNDKGEFKIENAPAGAKLRLVAWHEQKGFFLPGGANGIEIEVKDGDKLEKDLEIAP